MNLGKKAGVLLSVLLLLLCTASIAVENDVRPNIVIIMADDLGYGDLGCYGSTTQQTPNIDALAREGLRFTDYHSNGPICSPTRAALLTGRYPQRMGIDGVFMPKTHREGPGFPKEEITFAHMLGEAGYATALIGKWHLGYPEENRPMQYGFDEFWGYLSGNVDYISHVDNSGTADWWHNLEKTPEEGYSTDLITKHAVDYLRKDHEKPFCLYIAHEAPHNPFQGRNDPPERVVGNIHLPKRKDIDNAYREMITALDEGIGAIMTALKVQGLDENTFVFFCSDNGASKPGSNAPWRGWKGGVYEGGHRVPAIAYWPGQITPGECVETAMSMDIFPTLAALSGTHAPEKQNIDGINILPVLTQNAAIPERTLFWRRKDKRAARRGSWKVYKDKTGYALYNLEQDPQESRNIAKGAPEIFAALTEELAAWEAEWQDVPLIAP